MAAHDATMLEAMRKAMIENKEFRDMLISMVHDATRCSTEHQEAPKEFEKNHCSPQITSTSKGVLEGKQGNNVTITNISKVGVIPIPTYDDIFRQPETKFREPNKLYGKEILQKHFEDQHLLLLSNYREVRKWFKGYDVPMDLRHKKEEREAIEDIIQKNHNRIEALVFKDTTPYKWQVCDIYLHLLSYWQSKRKNSRLQPLSKEKNPLSQGNTQKLEENENLSSSQVNDSLIDNNEHEEQYEKVNEIQCYKDHSMLVEEPRKMCGFSEMDNFMLEMNSFEGLQPYNYEEDPDEATFDDDIPTSYCAFLHHGSSKRVEALKEVDTLVQNHISMPQEIATCLEIVNESKAKRKSVRKRKLSEKMKFHQQDKTTFKNSETKRGKSMENNKLISQQIPTSSKKIIEIETFSMEDLETILLKYTGAKTISNMYFSLRSTYIALKKIEPSFRFYCKDVKNPESGIMIRQIVFWLVENNKVKVNLMDNPLSSEDVIIYD